MAKQTATALFDVTAFDNKFFCVEADSSAFWNGCFEAMSHNVKEITSA